MHLLRGQISSTLNTFPEVDLWSKELGSTRRVHKTAHGLSTETHSREFYESVALRNQDT